MSDFNLVDANGSVSVRSFANAGLATRYANKHGLTVAKSIGALAIVADADTDTDATDDTEIVAIDATDIESVLEALDAETDANENAEIVTFRDTALSFDTVAVDSAVQSLRASFDRRDQFEASNGLSLVADSSYVRERNAMLKAEVAVSRLFLALGIDASDVIERKVSTNAMFNAKALKKIRELAIYTCGYGQKLERVTRAFIACALIATDRGVSVLTNETNRKFLCSAGFTGQISDQDLIDHLDELRHRAMTSGAETQSSQARNVLDVLGLGTIKSVHKNRDAIEIDATHAFFTQFRGDFMNV